MTDDPPLTPQELDERERVYARMDPRQISLAIDQPSFLCPRCGARSFNPHDIANRYCVRCHLFADDDRSPW